MPRATTIATMFLLAVTFFLTLPVTRLFAAFQPLIVALSIMVAALLVRLNRGMPALEWKGMDPEGRGKLTTKIVDLAREYVVIVSANSLLLVLLVSLTMVGDKQIAVTWLDLTQRFVSATIGALLGFSFSRMGYVVWRDYDVVKLQKTLIDGAAAKEALAKQALAAEDKVTRIHAAGLRSVASAEPKAWDED
jgi:hypothetical protein